ncbi:hypothetical protein [Marinithermus hydrothermalis]|uniref:Uncharacterized protein n=1 Tax=Marinithermus hydrothermalis (strain DSM 14884 / JCM 11576 / T1) TaxID=869210 RepID=F2NPJ9_MARHT|nr:hypothetical protein [Marinithermus hydrothermalis]AEB12500.1 hypothetical protein Marky_1765 [Marinithermus hydrothermalis DSM 14884]
MALRLKVTTFWVRPHSSVEALPAAGKLLTGLLEGFYERFPEYEGCLVYSQSPRRPRYVFVYVNGECSGLLPQAAEYLYRLLEQAFPQGEVRPYGRPWA